jgi:arylsulfatase A-like enzyme
MASPNIILFTIDALRASRTCIAGYERPTTPTFERLAKNAIVCSNAFARGAFSQPSVTELMTSTKAFDYGGYDNITSGRPPTLFDYFHGHGYHTVNLATETWITRYNGFKKSVDEEVMLYGLYAFPGNASIRIRNVLNQFEKNEISQENMLHDVVPELQKCFDDTEDYCQHQMQNWGKLSTDFPYSPLVQSGYDYKKIISLVAKHRRKLDADNMAYIYKYLFPARAIKDTRPYWLVKEWYYMRKPLTLVRQLLQVIASKFFLSVNPRVGRRLKHSIKNYPDAHSIANNLISKVKNLTTGELEKKPFFIWTHLQDCHSPYVSGSGARWHKDTLKYLKELGYTDEIDPTATFRLVPKDKKDAKDFSALYDAAVRSTDDAIGRVVDYLEEINELENTIICIHADHGEELGDHGDWGHFFRLYDHNTHIPLILYRHGMKAKRVSGFSSLLDVAPSLAFEAGLEPHPDWQGQKLQDSNAGQRAFEVLETFFGGSCLFDHRPLYMAARNHEYMYMWNEYPDPGDFFHPEQHELYDLNKDPEQQNNIYRPDHPVIESLQRMIAERLAEIPEISNQRIIDAFSSVGASVVSKHRNSVPKST